MALYPQLQNVDAAPGWLARSIGVAGAPGSAAQDGYELAAAIHHPP